MRANLAICNSRWTTRVELRSSSRPCSSLSRPPLRRVPPRGAPPRRHAAATRSAGRPRGGGGAPSLAIISHSTPQDDATEKLLLYGGAISQAGAVKAKGEQRRATSDFMELEQQRGISISSTVLSYEYDGRAGRILDTPGHQDFSEDTYRTLAAADNAVMLVDAAKGLEPQTRSSSRWRGCGGCRSSRL